MAEASRILITGGGIAGLSLAIALRRGGKVRGFCGLFAHEKGTRRSVSPVQRPNLNQTS